MPEAATLVNGEVEKLGNPGVGRWGFEATPSGEIDKLRSRGAAKFRSWERGRKQS